MSIYPVVSLAVRHATLGMMTPREWRERLLKPILARAKELHPGRHVRLSHREVQRHPGALRPYYDDELVIGAYLK